MKIANCLFSLAVFFFLCSATYAQTYLEEGFENNMPAGWEEIDVLNGGSWDFKNGGKEIEGENYPESAYEGNLNALFSFVENRVTKLVTPPMDLSGAVKAELQFAHAMFPWGYDKDELRVFYNEHPDSTWKLLRHYTTETNRWIERTLQLPDSAYSSQYRIAFEGISQGGAGVCVDDVKVIENGVIPKKIESIEYHQASERYIPSGSDNNAILRIDFEVTGNSGDLFLDSLAVKSLNTEDSDLKNNGVKLYATEDTVFSKENMIGEPTNFVAETAIFDNLHYSFSYGVTSIWVSYDVEQNINHESHHNTLDAKIESNAIKINNQTYPYEEESPSGSRILYESLLYEDFENVDTWALKGEFQIGKPKGLGSTGNYGWYSPDPDSNAVSGVRILGTDLDSLGENGGDYEPSLGENAYYALSPAVDCKYYQNVSVNYFQWLNIEMLDKSSVEIINEQEDTVEIWSNEQSYNDDSWVSRRIDISDQATRSSEIKIGYSLGPTNSSGQYGGWNLDDFSITGDYIAKDIGVSAWLTPSEGCGLSGEESVKVIVRNYGAEDFTEPVPIAFSIDNGANFQLDTIQQDIPVEDSITFIFDSKADFSEPGLYKVFAETRFAGDEDTRNDRFKGQLFAYPTETLPYSEKFEKTDGYWQSLGRNNTWEHGPPKGSYIDSAASGDNVWMTDLDGPYPVNDSSFLESPCFDFTGVSRPVIEMEICGDVEEHTDGMKLQYSYDGTNWHDVDSSSHDSWSWYNSNVDALNASGWSHNNAEWQTVRQFLPAEVTNYSSVKFRLLFQSDGFASGDEGYAIDNISIYEAPIDIGIASIQEPVSQCELSDSQYVKVEVKNYGVRPVPKNEEIRLKLKFNEEYVIADTFELDNVLAVGDKISHVFPHAVDMSDAGDYSLTAFTTVEENPEFYGNSSNDTLKTIVSVLGMPNYDLGPSIGTEQPDTLTLDAGEGYDDYQWHNGGPSTRFYDIPSDGTYFVTVTNSEGCSATDSIVVLPSNTDIGVIEVNNLNSACKYESMVSIEIGVKNFGEYDKQIGEKLPVGYTINQTTEVLDTLTLNQTMSPGDTAYFSFNNVDLTESKIYNFRLFTGYDGDINRQNDTLEKTIEVYGDPVVDLGADTLFTKRADTVVLNAGGGYASYNWQGKSADSTFNIQSKKNALYKVTVTDIHGCGEASDSVQIISDDFSVNKLIYPQNSCELTSEEYPEIAIQNNSQNNYPESTELYVGYCVDGISDNFRIDTIELSSELLPGDSYNYEFEEAVDLTDVGSYDFTAFVTYRPDVKTINDTLNSSVDVYGPPVVDLGHDTIFSTQPDTIIFNAGGGFKEYEWQDGSTDSTFNVTASNSNTYSVTVTAFHGCGTDTDSVLVVASDIAVEQLLSPQSNCSHSSQESVRVEVKNTGNDTLKPGEQIDIGYSLDSNMTVSEQIELSDTLFPGNSKLHEFESMVDLSSEERNELEVFIDVNDANNRNNTLSEQIITFGYPPFSFDADTIFTTSPDTLQFTVESGYSSYEWQDGTNNDTFNVSLPNSKEYSVTITDANGCSTKDSVFVSAYDLGISDILNPNSACDLSNDEEVEAKIKNFGADTLLAGETIPVALHIDDRLISTENLSLQDTLHPDSTLIFTYDQTADFSDNKTYQVQASSEFSADADVNNNEYVAEVDVYGPDLELGADTTVQSPTYEIDAGAGFTSYNWHDGSSGQTYTAEAIDENNMYTVTVTNDMNCSASDTIYVWFDVYPDMQITEIKKPVSGCRQEEPLPVVVKVKNTGKMKLVKGSTIDIGYKLDQNDIVEESRQLNSDLKPDSDIQVEFNKNVHLDMDDIYELQTFVTVKEDENTANDTLEKEIDIHYPDPQLAGKDTLFLEQDDFPYSLAVGYEYSDVLWQDGSTNNSFEVDDYGEYWVKVTDSYGCRGADTVIISDEKQVYVKELQASDYSLEIFPNPAKRNLNVRIRSQQQHKFSLSLISMKGTILYTENLNIKGLKILNIPVGQYAAGFYQLKIQSDEQIHIIPVIIK